MRIILIAIVVFISTFRAFAEPSPQKENECAGTAAFKTAKDVFHKNARSHADASLIAYSTQKGRDYGKLIFDQCVGAKSASIDK